MTRVLVCGGRDYADDRRVRKVLSEIHKERRAGWLLRIAIDGETFHNSEHGSRIAACRAADRALTRAIALRSTDIEPRKRP